MPQRWVKSGNLFRLELYLDDSELVPLKVEQCHKEMQAFLQEWHKKGVVVTDASGDPIRARELRYRDIPPTRQGYPASND